MSLENSALNYIYSLACRSELVTVTVSGSVCEMVRKSQCTTVKTFQNVCGIDFFCKERHQG